MTVLKASAEYYPRSENKIEFINGMRDCTVIAAGYFIVSFTLGIAMKNAGLTPVEGLVCSLLNNASAGEYAGITMISAGASYLETALMTLTANIRYLLMSCSLSQKISPETPVHHRFLIGFDVTDELFGLAISRRSRYLNPYYYYGAVLIAMPAWAGGTVCGVLAGSFMPVSLVSAFSAALYAMFLAIIIPEGRRNKAVGFLIVVSFMLSFLCGKLPVISTIPEGIRTIILTLLLAGGAALLAPVKEEEEHE